MLWDTHMHTEFSADSSAKPEAMLNSAAEKGLAGICFTDHMDYNYPGGTVFEFTPEAYFEKLSPLREQYADRCSAAIGIELGLQPEVASKNSALLSSYPFDFVIGSSHVMHGLDPYYPECYLGKTEDEVYLEYFTSILENITAFDGFDVYGHLDYVVRYGPDKNTYYSYGKFKEVIDEILRALIQRGKGIEINTAGFKYGLCHPNPTEDIIKRYRELGGEIITIGSDAHKPEDMAYDFDKVPQLLKACGFQYFTVFKKRKAEFFPLF